MVTSNTRNNVFCLPTRRISKSQDLVVLARTVDQGQIHTIGRVMNVTDPWRAACEAFEGAPDKERLLVNLNYEIIVMRGQKIIWSIEMSVGQLRAEMSAIDASAAIESVAALAQNGFKVNSSTL
jgi:hypothetical protein